MVVIMGFIFHFILSYLNMYIFFFANNLLPRVKHSSVETRGVVWGRTATGPVAAGLWPEERYTKYIMLEVFF
jgi:hypothetical protein